MRVYLLFEEKEKNMKDFKVINAKITPMEFEDVERYSETHNMSIAAIIKLCLRSLIYGEMDIIKGELVPHMECKEEIKEEAKEEYDFKGIVKAFEKKRYTPNAIKASIESIESQILDGPNYKERNDWGC